MNPVHFSRRSFLQTLAVGSAGLSWPVRRLAAGRLEGGAPLKLGVASYSLREFNREQAIEMVRALGTPYLNVKSFHLPYELSPEALRAGRRQFEAAGLQIVGGGTITLKEDRDDAVEPYFAYARHAGMPLMVIAPTPEVLPRIERFVKQYDIAVAIHNHGPEDPYFPGPADVLPYIQDMDPRVGLCVDVGHTARTGVDVVDAVAAAGTRVLDLHMKDLRDLSDRDSQCIVGEGRIPVAALFHQLISMGFPGYVNLEYEIDAENPLPGMQRSMAYLQGVLAGLAMG